MFEGTRSEAGGTSLSVVDDTYQRFAFSGSSVARCRLVRCNALLYATPVLAKGLGQLCFQIPLRPVHQHALMTDVEWDIT